MNINQPVIQMYLDFEKMILNFLISIHLVCSDLKYSNTPINYWKLQFLIFSISQFIYKMRIFPIWCIRYY